MIEVIKFLLIIVAFFFGLAFLVHTCSRNKYVLKYESAKRKIEIYPMDKSHQPHR